WQVREAGGALGLALVVAGAADEKVTGALVWQKLDVEGRAIGNPMTIGRANVGADADAVRGPRGTYFAWTDRSGVEPEVTGAYLDDDGTLTAAASLVPFAGGSVLAGLAAGRAGALIAWDEPHKRSRALRPLHLGRVELAPASG